MKILVNICIPAISKQYDVLIPDSLRVKKAISLLASAIETLSNQLYISSGEECLCLVEKNLLLKHNMTLKKCGIKNGDHLIMM